jgi:hypothetical protein
MFSHLQNVIQIHLSRHFSTAAQTNNMMRWTVFLIYEPQSYLELRKVTPIMTDSLPKNDYILLSKMYHISLWKSLLTSLFTYTELIRRCIQKFSDWPARARTANGTALCHYMQLYRYFVSQSSKFCRHNPLCWFSTSACCCSVVTVYFVTTQSGNFWIHPHIISIISWSKCLFQNRMEHGIYAIIHISYSEPHTAQLMAISKKSL